MISFENMIERNVISYARNQKEKERKQENDICLINYTAIEAFIPSSFILKKNLKNENK